MDIINLVLLPLVVSSFVTFIITPLVIAFAWRFGLIDDPKRHLHPKVIHTKPIPRGGGLAIYIARISAALLFLPHDFTPIGIPLRATLLISTTLLHDKF